MDQIGSVTDQANSEHTQNNQPQSNITNLRRRNQHAGQRVLRPASGDNNLDQPVNNVGTNNTCKFCFWIFLACLASLSTVCITLMSTAKWRYFPTPISPKGPSIEINTKNHVPPSSTSWKLVARCRAYNSSYTIKQCEWRQVHPRPTSQENTVLPGGTKDCLASISHDVDATLKNLPVPGDRGNYTFELSCSDNTGHTGMDNVNILVNELIEPVITINDDTIIIQSSKGIAKLDASCKTFQGKVVETKWIHIEEPNAIPPKIIQEGFVQLFAPGIYKFKYQCSDSFGGSALRYSYFR